MLRCVRAPARRTMCGTSRPTKPTRPAALTVPAASRAPRHVHGDRHARYINAQARCRVVSERQDVDGAAECHQHAHAHRDEYREHAHLAPARVARGAHHPPECSAYGGCVGIGERHHDDCVRECTHHHTRHQHHACIATPARSASHDQCERNGHERASKSGRGHHHARRVQRYREHRAHRRAPRHAKQVRFREPVACCSLERRAGSCQARAHERGKEHARQPQRAHHGHRHWRTGSHEAINHLTRAEPDGAQHDAGEHCGHEKQHEQEPTSACHVRT